MGRRPAWIWFALVIASAASPARVRSEPVRGAALMGRGASDDPPVSCPKGASLETVLASLARATNGIVLADPPDVPRTLEAELRERPLGEALMEVSRSFHLHWRRRGNGLVFLRRLWDPRETLRLEVPELAAISADLERLIRPLVPYVGPAAHDYLRFTRSLTPQQQEAMLSREGMPFSGLGAEQRDLWMMLSYHGTYLGPLLDLERASRALAGWQRCRLVYRLTDTPVGGRAPTLFFEYPGRGRDGGPSLVELPSDFRDELKAPLVQASGERLPADQAALPASFRSPVDLPAGVTTAAALSTLAADAARVQIVLPEHARERRLLVTAGRAAAREALTALADLYGWALADGGGGQYYLRRPRFTAGKDLRAIHQQMLALLPPTVRLLLPQGKEGPDPARAAANLRYRTELSSILGEITLRKGGPWESAPVAGLAPALQRRLANLMFETFLWGTLMGGALTRLEPYPWLTTPEQGVFYLSGPILPGKKPAIELKVRQPNGVVEGTGYIIGTSSLEK